MFYDIPLSSNDTKCISEILSYRQHVCDCHSPIEGCKMFTTAKKGCIAFTIAQQHCVNGNFCQTWQYLSSLVANI